MVFQFASTNLVFEIGIVMWLFLGWEFTLAEFVGGLILIVLMWIGLRLFVSRREEERARVRALAAEGGHQHQSAGGSRILSLDAWSDVAHNFRGDWEMLWKEITAGFLIAGFVALLPMDFFNALFLTDTGGWVQLLENVIVGPIVAVLSFVCSVGNVPLAAVLWAGGISFSGVIAFIYADLIIIPLVLVYGRYYGWRVATLLVSIMFAAIVAAALAVDGLFSAFGLIPGTRPSIESITERGISWNYTTVLNIVFTAVAAGLIGLTMRRAARDPVCGMTVDRGKAVTIEHHGKTYFFCGPGCRSKFEADPERFVAREASAMRADPAARR
jgi:YHS domain-containing protein